jgi:hypothetical protein
MNALPVWEVPFFAAARERQKVSFVLGAQTVMVTVLAPVFSTGRGISQ